MRVIDYNGEGDWSRDAIVARYSEYAKRFGVSQPRNIAPKEHTSGEVIWVYPVMERVIDGIAAGDEACKWIGIEFVEQDSPFPFGRILKSNAARALRRATLNADQENRLRHRFSQMLLRENVPREYREYAKLLKRIGLGETRAQIDAGVNRNNPYVMRYYSYFTGA